MNKITALNVFRRVVEMGTFKAAADDLRLSQAAVSKNINELEAFLGIALINRTTRRLSVTESGMAYYGQICAVLDSLDAADQSIMAASFTPRGRLTPSAIVMATSASGSDTRARSAISPATGTP